MSKDTSRSFRSIPVFSKQNICCTRLFLNLLSVFVGFKELLLITQKVKFKIRKLGYSSLGNYPRIFRSRDILLNDMSACDTFSPVAREGKVSP